MRVRWLIVIVLGACNSVGFEIAGGGDSLVELRAYAAAGDRLATIEYVEGGGAAGYVGLRVRAAASGHEWRTLAFVRARDVAIAWHGSELTITGSFDDWDRTQNERTLHAADGDGIRATMRQAR